MALRTYRPTGALIINPLRKYKRRPARRATKRKTYKRRAKRRTYKRRANPRHRGPSKAKRRAAALKGWRGRKRGGAKRRRNPRVRAYRRGGAVVKQYVRAGGAVKRHSRKRRRRKNPAGIASGFRKVPLIGPLLAEMIGFLPFSAAGAISVSPTIWLAKWLGQFEFMSMVPASLYYPTVSVILAAVVAMFGKRLGLSSSNRTLLATAIAAAGGGVGMYKLQSGQDMPMESELGLLEMTSQGYGEGMQTSVVPLRQVLSRGPSPS